MYYGTYQDKKYPKKGFGKEEWDILEKMKMGDEEVLATASELQEIFEQYKEGWTKANFASAISPVIGITVKYNYFAIRATYQYRWAIQKDLQDFIGPSRLSFGIGVAF
jgi:hypothetical protein